MLAKRQFVRASWTLADQAVVSLGTFLTNVVLARLLAPTDYGTFALVFGILLTLQLVTSSLLFYPLSIRRSVSSADERLQLMGAGLLLTGLMCIPLAAAVAGVLLALGRMDLILPVVLYFVSWQCQEAARRGILAEFRHKAAIPGDVISYLGQVAMIFLLIRMESLTLANVFYAMASTAALSAVIQLRQAEMVLPGLGVMRRTMRDFASIGGWSLANNVAATLRIQIFPWILTILHGPVAVAPFQAALNVANVANPLLIGLCNIIPQTAAQAHSKGKRQAWLAARPFILVGIPPAFLYCALVLIAPTLVLQVMYGSGSPYIEHTDAVRLLVLAWIVSYAADMTCSYLHGVDAPKVAFRINALGAVMAFVLAVPLVMKLDLIGACIALLAASVARLAVSQALLSRLFANERLHPA